MFQNHNPKKRKHPPNNNSIGEDAKRRALGNQNWVEEALKAELRASKEEAKVFIDAYNNLVLKIAHLTNPSLSLDLGVIRDEVLREENVLSVGTLQSSIDIAPLPHKLLQKK